MAAGSVSKDKEEEVDAHKSTLTIVVGFKF
jgi:hypothetical protein